jgi:hypothetical protein
LTIVKLFKNDSTKARVNCHHLILLLTAKIVGLVLLPKQGKTMVMAVVFTVFPCKLQRNQQQPFRLTSRGNLPAGKAQQQAGSRPT